MSGDRDKGRVGCVCGAPKASHSLDLDGNKPEKGDFREQLKIQTICSSLRRLANFGETN